MMRNNRIFQSLGITALGMMVRNSNRMQQGSAITDGGSALAVTQQGSSSEYSPDYEVIEEDEVDDSVVEEEDKETCESNKDNRSKVKFHQKTGSRPYISHVHALKEARKGEELSAIDLFKECHNGKKTGFSEPVKKSII
uniref:Uncharacterized protein n=1 Tax=Hordeum vulgare subsp. vulgare TaxID=112509 RepID=A0A8I6YSG7_HORVV